MSATLCFACIRVAVDCLLIAVGLPRISLGRKAKHVIPLQLNIWCHHTFLIRTVKLSLSSTYSGCFSKLACMDGWVDEQIDHRSFKDKTLCPKGMIWDAAWSSKCKVRYCHQQKHRSTCPLSLEYSFQYCSLLFVHLTAKSQRTSPTRLTGV